MRKRIVSLLLCAAFAVAPAFALGGCAPGTVVLYTDIPQAMAEKLIEPFLKSSGLKVQVVAFSSTESMLEAIVPSDRQGQGGNRRTPEASESASAAPTPKATAKNAPADVVLSSNMLALTELKNRNGLESYTSANATGIPYGAKANSYWYGFGGYGWGIASNTDLMKDNPPDSLQDLGDDRFPNGAVGMPIQNDNGYYIIAMYALMGRDITVTLVQTLLLKGSQLELSPAACMDQVASGRLQAAVTTYAQAKKLEGKSSPVKFVFPDQEEGLMGAYVQYNAVGIAKGGQFLEGAKKLDDYLVSTQAEKLSVELGLGDVTMRECGSDAPVVRPINIKPEEVLDAQNSASSEFQRIVNETYGGR